MLPVRSGSHERDAVSLVVEEYQEVNRVKRLLFIAILECMRDYRSMELKHDTAAEGPPCACGAGTMLLLRAGEAATHPGRYYYKCPHYGKHVKSFIWCDDYQIRTRSATERVTSGAREVYVDRLLHIHVVFMFMAVVIFLFGIVIGRLL
ncbi:hypothetical protein SASPL_144490 [Salvia splendens]|uniref:Zinc finger GRF-type domain-containing protein n=1 Tax=Salvia splendens TaxID=180675 RepID=A0A8X8WEX1_SALSN|nr:hypothetical protein SASPL_144490 [Salvia splendens]